MKPFLQVPFLAGLGLSAAFAPPSGYKYTVRVVVTENQQTLTAHVWAKGDKARVVLEGGGANGSPLRHAGYLIARDSGKTIFMVDSTHRVYIPFGEGPGAMRPGAMGPAIQASDVQVKAEELGTGEKILGYGTKRYRMTEDYTRTTGTRRARVHAVMEYWATRDLPSYINPQFLSGLFAARSMARDDELSRQAAAAMRRLNPGAVLKTVATTTTTEEGGTATQSTSTAEVTELAEAPVDDALLEVPPGYRMMTMPMPMGRP
jgi:hypothetical protein